MQRYGDAESLSLIVELVRSGEARARPELQRVTGLGRGLISERVSQLLRAGVIVEGDLGASTGGRAARELQINPSAGAILVCYADLTELFVGVVDLAGNLLESSTIVHDFAAGPKQMFAHTEAAWATMLSQLRLKRSDVWGIGVGIPAHSDFASATLIDSPALPSTWKGYSVRQTLSQKFGCPVWIETAENLHALGELRMGAAKRQTNFVYMNADLVVGCGIVSGGRLTRGAQGAAGNVGHITIGGDALCRCGRRGCLEAVAGGEALLREAESAGRRNESRFFADRLATRTSLGMDDLSEGLRQGDETAQRLVAISGTLIGQALAATINVLNPSMVVAGGRLPQLGDLFLACMREAIYRHSLPFVTRDLAIVVVQQTPQTGLLGAGQVVIDQLFLPEAVAKWFPNNRPSSALHS